MLTDWSLKRPLQAIATLGATIGSFFLPPSDAIGLGEQSAFMTFGKTFIVVIVWFITTPTIRARGFIEDLRWWRKLAIATGILSIITFVGYQALTALWTEHFPRYNQTILLGSGFTSSLVESKVIEVKLVEGRTITLAEAEEMLKKESSENLLRSVGWKPSAVWSWQSLFGRKLVLAIVYVIGLPLFCVALISAIQTSYCAKAGPRPSKPAVPAFPPNHSAHDPALECQPLETSNR